MPTKCKRSGKERHHTEDDAQERLSVLSKTNRSRKPVRYYHCGYCNGFHLTSKANGVEVKQGNIPHPELFEKYLIKDEEVEE